MAGEGTGVEIVFEDDDVVGLVKPSGLPTANAAPGIDSVYTILRARPPADRFIGIVSRLDAAVSGVLVVAKTGDAAAALARQFRLRTVDKTYLAIVEGRFPAPLGAWVDWHDTMLRRPNQRTSELVGPPGAAAKPQAGGTHADSDADDGEQGRPVSAHVRARVVRRAGEASLVELLPTTGRRHQLRLQLSARGCPIVGDRLYGARLPLAIGIALHAACVRFLHPRTEEAVELAAPPPSQWKRKFPALFTGR
ncbi:MAG: RluA family pseudouridine synthase [Planctomycetia bacterium]|jgi:23S rRNA pseudouridine1911/1915/1917 synthase